MKLKKALKQKGQILKESTFLYQMLEKYNSVPTENANNRAYDPKESLSGWLQKVEELIKLKVAVQQANIPMFEKIIRMAELKGVVKDLSYLSCYSGVSGNEEYRKATAYDSVITVKERDELIKKIEKEIATIQDELDEFNLRTEIAL
jgi:AAA+ ATPase superfamily predicted ATPase